MEMEMNMSPPDRYTVWSHDGERGIGAGTGLHSGLYWPDWLHHLTDARQSGHLAGCASLITGPITIDHHSASAHISPRPNIYNKFNNK